MSDKGQVHCSFCGKKESMNETIRPPAAEAVAAAECQALHLVPSSRPICGRQTAILTVWSMTAATTPPISATKQATDKPFGQTAWIPKSYRPPSEDGGLFL